MLVFQACEGDYKTIADKYIKKGEIARISRPIEFKGVRYREIVYNKKLLGSIRQGVKGIVFITEDLSVVKDKGLIRELTGLAYHLEVFFDESYSGSIKRAVAPEKEILKQEIDFGQMAKALEILKEENISGAEMVSHILTSLPAIKRENNECLTKLIEKLQSCESDTMIFTDEVMNEVDPLYKDALLRNFKRVKLINKGRAFYDDIKKQAYSRRKKFKYRTKGKDVVEGLTKLEYGMNFVKQVLSVYDKVTDMNEEQYMRYLNEMDKDNINHRIEMTRF